MRYLSICSGIEAASVAWEQLGWEAVGFSEIEPFPCAVLRHRFPHVPLHGDFTALIENPPSCDVLVGGTPCQAFSVAGSRRSLDDARGNLTLAYVMLADAIDRRNREEGKEPCITVWENVPGVFSTKDNAFGAFLGGLSGEDGPLEPPGGKWTHCGAVLGPTRAVCWRVLDAQYFGLAQRRQRVFVVASAREGFDPSQVLLEWEGVRRDSAPSRQARKDPAAALGVGVEERGGERDRRHDGERDGRGREDGRGDVTGALTARFGGSAMGAPEVDAGLYIPVPKHERWPAVVAPTLNAHFGEKQGLEDQHALGGAGLFVPMPASALAFDSYNGTVGDFPLHDPNPTLDASYYKGAGERAGVERNVVATYDVSPALNTVSRRFNHGHDTTAYVVGDFPWPQEVADPLTSNEAKTYTHEGTTFRTRTAYCYPDADQLGYAPEGEAPASTPVQEPFVFDTTQVTPPANFSSPKPGDPSHPLAAAGHAPTLAASAGGRMVVRRLTPRECERLQGFPDDWTLIPWKNKPAVDCPDGPRYKALGNSMAVPCMRWIGRRIDAHVKGTSP